MMDSMERLSSLQFRREQEALTPEQEAYVDQFTQERIAATLSTTATDVAKAEEHLRQAYQVVGLEPPHIRWFDSPLALALAPEPAPQSIETLVRTSVEARIATTIAESMSESVWDSLFTLLDVIGDGVWGSVGRLIQSAVRESIGRRDPNVSYVRQAFDRRSLQNSLWEAARASLWTNAFINLSLRIEDSVQAYNSAAWLAFSAFFAHVFGPHDLIHFTHFNERVSGYRLGRTEAWLVRKPVCLERNEQGSLHAEGGMCVRYRDGWGFYAWRGHRVSEKLILHPEQITTEDWLQEKNTDIRRAIQERIGHQRFARMVGGLRIESGALVVDLGNGPEPTGYCVHLQDPFPRVCLLPLVFFQSQCKKACPRTPPCPIFSDLQI